MLGVHPSDDQYVRILQYVASIFTLRPAKPLDEKRIRGNEEGSLLPISIS